MNGVSVDVVGVMPEGFRGLVVSAPDFWAPLSLLDQVRRTIPETRTPSSSASSGG
jgi:hypothetical protein